MSSFFKITLGLVLTFSLMQPLKEFIQSLSYFFRAKARKKDIKTLNNINKGNFRHIDDNGESPGVLTEKHINSTRSIILDESYQDAQTLRIFRVASLSSWW